VLFVGPADLSHTLGIPGQFDNPTFLDALRVVAEGAAASGKAAGILLWRASELGRFVELGYRFVGLGSDGGSVVEGARAAMEIARSVR
jgi:4-hydroxy-2-oxoheptanedioate aldolase